MLRFGQTVELVQLEKWEEVVDSQSRPPIRLMVEHAGANAVPPAAAPKHSTAFGHVRGCLLAAWALRHFGA
jgi:hypothetical protein